MYIVENPVLQRELLVNLRMGRGFVLLFCYVAALGAVVFMAWPNSQRLDLTTSPVEARQLVNLFFLSQYVLLALMAPSFAAGTITGEKERRTYEMLLASPLRPGAIVVGKLVASLGYLAVLVFASLPIVMLCLPLGGVSLYEVLATYAAMAASVVLFGMICVTASSRFTRTIAALVVSYLIILPIVLVGVLFYRQFERGRGVSAGDVVVRRARRMRGDLRHSVRRRDAAAAASARRGRRGQGSGRSRLGAAKGRGHGHPQQPVSRQTFRPDHRDDVMADGLNPVYDKEMRSELFGQGTLMLRLVIQLSMFLALPLMAACMYMAPQTAPWYASYVLLFNMLVGPVFSAGAITSERERETLELLLCTTLSPWQILWGKLFSSLRISAVLTSFLVWPLLLSCLLPPWTYWSDMPTMFGYAAIIAMSSLTTTALAIFCSVVFRKTSVSMMTAYLAILLLYALPLAVEWFARLLFPASPATALVGRLTFTSPFAASFSLPLALASQSAGAAHVPAIAANWPVFCSYMAFYAVVNAAVLGSILWLFNKRWRVST